MENTGDQPAEWADVEEEEESVKSPKRTEEKQAEDAETETLESPTVAAEHVTALPPGRSPASALAETIESPTVAAEDVTAFPPGGSPASSLAETLVDRAERKREREKKRRFDLNGAFDQLKELIFRINPEVRKEAEQRMAANNKAKNEEQGVFNRLELVLYALNTLEVVYEENEERKMVIQQMARGMLADGRKAGITPEALVAPKLPNPAASSFPPPDIQRQLQIEQRLKLEAAIAGAAARAPPAGFSSPNREALLAVARQQAALARPLPPPLGVDSSFGARNPHAAAAAHLLGQSSLPLAGDLGRQADFGGDALYRARLNRILQEQGERESLLAASNLASAFPPLGPMGHAEDSLRQAIFREQAIAAAARAQQGGMPPEMDPYGGAKRMRNF